MDDLAIQLYRVDNPDGIWEYEDEAVRLHYRKRALEEVVPTHGFEPRYPEPNSGVLPLDEAG